MKKLKIMFILFSCTSFFIVNGQPAYDSIKTSKWHHSISVEIQLHNNFIYRRSNNIRSIYTNQVNGDSINESKLQPGYKALYSISYKKINLSLGVDYYKYMFVLENNNQIIQYFKYYLVGLPIEVGGITTFGKLGLRYYIALVPSLALKEYYYYNDLASGIMTKYRFNINDLHYGGGYGLDLLLKLSPMLDLYLNFSSRFAIENIVRKYPIGKVWISYSSFNFGIGLKYKII